MIESVFGSAHHSAQSNPIFSVIVPVSNGVSTIGRCLQSISVQTTSDWELIVIDAASTDGTQAILAHYGDAISYWESETDRGICHAWNKALAHARGDWLMFLGADDKLANSGVLAHALPDLPDPAVARVAYGSINLVAQDGQIIGSAGRPWEEAGEAFYRYNTLPHQAVFHHRSLFDRHGRFDETFRICGDYEMLLRELKSAQPWFMPDFVVADVAVGGLSMRESSAFLATREVRRAQHRHGIVNAPEWRSFRIYRAAAYEGLRRILGPGFARAAANAYKRAADRGVGQRR